MADENEKKPEALPETVFVKRVVDGDGSYLDAYDDMDRIVDDDGTVTEVGVYELKRTKRMRKVAQEV